MQVETQICRFNLTRDYRSTCNSRVFLLCNYTLLLFYKVHLTLYGIDVSPEHSRAISRPGVEAAVISTGSQISAP